MVLSHWALLGFATWTLLLVLCGIGLPRVSAVLLKKARANSFRADVPHGTDRYQRTMRAHLNAVENLPVFAALVVLGSLNGLDQDSVFQTAAIVVLPARILQSTSHISSGRNRAVLARFTFFSIQLLCMAIMIARLVGRAAS
jgi:uncharacterized MAPEG superfamily protein